MSGLDIFAWIVLFILVPQAGKRFMSLIVIDQDQYTPGVYYGGSHSLTASKSARAI